LTCFLCYHDNAGFCPSNIRVSADDYSSYFFTYLSHLYDQKDPVDSASLSIHLFLLMFLKHDLSYNSFWQVTIKNPVNYREKHVMSKSVLLLCKIKENTKCCNLQDQGCICSEINVCANWKRQVVV